MQVRRREFLGALVAGAAIYGLDRFALGGDEKAAEPPLWFKDALAEMKATKKPGIAIVLPAGKDARAALLTELQSLLREPSFEAQTHLVEAVYVVVDGIHAGAKKDETLVLLDGKDVYGTTAKLTAATFAGAVRPLLRDNERLAKRAKAARTVEVEKLIADLGADAEKDSAKIDAAVARLTESFASAGPAVIEAYEGLKDGEVKSRLYWIIGGAFARRRGDQGEEFERPLPFGAKWKLGAIPMPEVDPCPPCGMMRIPPRSHDLLEFLAKDPGTTK